MQGVKIKKKLLEGGFVLAKVALSMGESPQNLDILLRAKDVKSGTIERICLAINKTIDFFYSEKEYEYLLPKVEIPGYGEVVALKEYTKLVRENERLLMELESLKEKTASYSAPMKEEPILR